jgi:hypothetical protein
MEREAKSATVQLDLAKSKFEQLQANFNALKMNHERALSQTEELNKDIQVGGLAPWYWPPSRR